MTADIIDGRAFARKIRANVRAQVTTLADRHNLTPGLAVVLVGADPASKVYVNAKLRACAEAGIRSFEHRLDAGTSEGDILTLLNQLNADPQVHGILVQLPLPDHVSPQKVINAISPDKDVDGFHVENAGRLATGQKGLAPCTPLGCILLLRDYLGDLTGKNAVVVGCSNIVGKPMAQMLLDERCTVSIAHIHTTDIADLCRRADILVVAVGKAGLVKRHWIKPGAVVVDVGINRVKREGAQIITGDVEFAPVSEVARAITPVPGGVGPMTIACLLANTVTACRRTIGLPAPTEFSY